MPENIYLRLLITHYVKQTELYFAGTGRTPPDGTAESGSVDNNGVGGDDGVDGSGWGEFPAATAAAAAIEQISPRNEIRAVSQDPRVQDNHQPTHAYAHAYAPAHIQREYGQSGGLCSCVRERLCLRVLFMCARRARAHTHTRA